MAPLLDASRYTTGRRSGALVETEYHLALTLQKLGRDDESQQALLRARRADPEGEYGRKAKPC